MLHGSVLSDPVERMRRLAAVLICLLLITTQHLGWCRKFCPDKWTRKSEEGRVEEEGHEEVLHEDVKEDQDVAAHPTTRTDS